MQQKPEAVVPDFLSEMSPHAAWNLALNTIAPLAEWNSFWNDGLETGDDIRSLLVKEKIDGKRKFRYRGPQRRLGGRRQGLYSWRFRHTRVRQSEAKPQHETNAKSASGQEE